MAPQLGVEMRYHAAVSLLKARGKWVAPVDEHGAGHGSDHASPDDAHEPHPVPTHPPENAHPAEK